MKQATLLIPIFLCISLTACWFAEFPAPRGSVNVQMPDSDSAKTLYQDITDYLRSHGFKETSLSPITPFGHSLVINGNSEFYKEFQFTELSNPYVISLLIDMDPVKGKVVYQYDELPPGTVENGSSLFSTEGCKLVIGLDDYALEIVDKNNGTKQGPWAWGKRCNQDAN